MMLDPIKKPINPKSKVMVKLVDTELMLNKINTEKRNIKIKGLKSCVFKISYLFKKLKKFSLG